MAFDEEHIDPHGECAAEIHRLQEQLATARACTAKALRVALELYVKDFEEDFDAIAIELHRALSPTPNQEKPE